MSNPAGLPETGPVRSGAGVWRDLVGQHSAVSTLRRAVSERGHSMTHAWLFTGPPGSGRSNVARSFAAALQCHQSGCGTCNACRTTISGAHPDVTAVRTEKLSIGVDEVRALVRKASMSPTTARHQIIIIEDADRITESGANALLKSIEEPAPRTVWMLCAPTPDDVVVTVRSRCRSLHLATPSNAAVAALLVERDGVDEAMATFAARVAQGHIGRARIVATSEEVRNRRHEILKIPGRLVSVGACLYAADDIVKAAAAEAERITADIDIQERAALSEALGLGGKKGNARRAAASLKELEDSQKARTKRLQRDALDRMLSELTTYYRDVLVVQVTDGDPGRLVNADLVAQLQRSAASASAEGVVRCLDAILQCRTALEANVAPLLAVEAMLLSFAEVTGASAAR